MDSLFKHESRDLKLPEQRTLLLDKILLSLKANPDVRASFVKLRVF
jgi:hypothetical protein